MQAGIQQIKNLENKNEKKKTCMDTIRDKLMKLYTRWSEHG